MALARCENHPPRTYRYRRFANPIGFPETAVICGATRCEAPARIWLDDPEIRDHARGVRIFSPPSQAAKFRVGDDPILN
jgi:hypothetical protein